MPSDNIDYHPDSGAGDGMDAIQDANHPDTERASGDVGSTTFEPSDAHPSKQSRYNELRKRHHEHWNSDPKKNNDTNVAYDARMVCNRLELSEHQEERSLKLIDEHRGQGQRYEVTIMAVVTYVLNKDNRWIQRDNDEYGDPMHSQYMEILNDFEITKSLVQDHVARIRSVTSSATSFDDVSEFNN